MTKKNMVIILFLMMIVGVESVSAKCYEIKNTRTGVVSYSNSVDNIESYETATLLDNNKKCKTDGINLNNKVTCGNIGTFHKKIPEITSWLITVVEVLVPVILVIMGMIDFVKGLVSQKEDEIRKGQQVFIKRLITGIIIFFIVVFVKLIISAVSNSIAEKNNIVSCIDCFISNKCS